MSDNDPRLPVLAGLFADVAWDELGAKEGVSVEIGLAALDAADRAAGIVRVDTNDEALVAYLARVRFPVGGAYWTLHREEARRLLAALREAAQ